MAAFNSRFETQQRFAFTRTSLRYVRVFAIENTSVVCLSVMFVRQAYSGVEAFGNISSPLCTLAIL